MEQCKKCNKKYKEHMFYNYNLSLCEKCYNKEEKENNIVHDSFVDNVSHKIICPICGRKYNKIIVDTKCKTKNCPVHFFWDDLDSVVFAKFMADECRYQPSRHILLRRFQYLVRRIMGK